MRSTQSVPANRPAWIQAKGSQLGKTLGSSYEVQSFGVELGDRLFVVTPRRHAAFQFGDQRRVGCTIGRAQAHIGSPLRPGGIRRYLYFRRPAYGQ